jgi:hypothetical protein
MQGRPLQLQEETVARKQYENSPADIAEDRRGAGLLKAAAAELQKMQRQAGKTTTGKAAAAQFNVMQRQAAKQQQAKKIGKR